MYQAAGCSWKCDAQRNTMLVLEWGHGKADIETEHIN